MFLFVKIKYYLTEPFACCCYPLKILPIIRSRAVDGDGFHNVCWMTSWSWNDMLCWMPIDRGCGM